MLFKLVMPRADKTVRKGFVARWLKSEGDPVNYGEDLLEVVVDDIRMLKRFGKPGRILSSKLKIRKASYSRRNAEIRMRITASDMGVMRKIYAGEGDGWEPGDTVALLTTNGDEAVEARESQLAEAAEFRVVVNPLGRLD